MLTVNPTICPKCHDTFYNEGDERAVKEKGMCSGCIFEQKEFEDLK